MMQRLHMAIQYEQVSDLEGAVRRHLLVWIAKVLDLCLGEFSDSEKALTRGDLIPIRLPDLRCRKRQLASVVVQQVPEPQSNPSDSASIEPQETSQDAADANYLPSQAGSCIQ